MLMCNETITLVRTDGVNLSTEVVCGCSWFDKVSSSIGDKAQIPSREVKVRIPLKRVPAMFPMVGDVVVRGTVPSTVTSVSGLKGMNYARVMVVADNRRGGIPHVGLTCQ